MQNIIQYSSNTRFALIINWKFHKQNKWVSALTPYIVDAIIKEFNPIIISSQLKYNLVKNKLKYIISMEPGWAAPRIEYDRKIDCEKAVFYSDPHYEPEQRFKYFMDNHFDFVFSYYKSPFFRHFKNFPEDKFVHMPWAIPNDLISKHQISNRNNDVVIFGAQHSEAYDIRNWCRMQNSVIAYDNSGVENKKMTDKEYFSWLAQFDAIVAAGSSNPDYNLVTPKYFEIASSGALLIGQYCNDLEDLGFNNTNSLLFSKEDFTEKVNYYKVNPDKFLNIRRAGRKIIEERHKVSDRIKLMKRVFEING